MKISEKIKNLFEQKNPKNTDAKDKVLATTIKPKEQAILDELDALDERLLIIEKQLKIK